MSRTYTDTPEPRYVEKAAFAENAEDLPAPTIADAGKAIVVGDDGKYELGEVDAGYDVTTTTEVLLVPNERSWGEVTGAWVSTGNVSNGFNIGDTIRFTIDGHVYEYVAESKDLGGQTICFAGEFNPEESVLGPCVLSLENGETGPFLQFINPTEPSNEITSAEKVIETVIVTDDFALARGYGEEKTYLLEPTELTLEFEEGNGCYATWTSNPFYYNNLGDKITAEVGDEVVTLTVSEISDDWGNAESNDYKYSLSYWVEDEQWYGAFYDTQSTETYTTTVSAYTEEKFVTDDFKEAVAASGSTGGQLYEFSSGVQQDIASVMTNAVQTCITTGNTYMAISSLEPTDADNETAERAYDQAEAGIMPVFKMVGDTCCTPTTIVKSSSKFTISLLIPNYSVLSNVIRITMTIDIDLEDSQNSIAAVMAEKVYTVSDDDDNPPTS